MVRRPKLKLLTGATETAAARGYVLDDHIGFLLRIAMQRHTSIFMSQMVEDLTQTQFAAMAKLMEVGPCSQNHLGRLIYLDASTIKGVVDRLQLRGFVATCDDPNDRRRRAVTLTDKGKRATEAATKIASKITRQTLAPLTSDEQRQVLRLVRRLS
jgi:DNA-binding MarR family transcriptional regulator